MVLETSRNSPLRFPSQLLDCPWRSYPSTTHAWSEMHGASFCTLGLRTVSVSPWVQSSIRTFGLFEQQVQPDHLRVGEGDCRTRDFLCHR